MDGHSAAGSEAARLTAEHGRADGVCFEASPLGGVVAILTATGGRAVVALQGAQVLSFVPAGDRDVLWLSPAARLATGKATRGGIPVCWPWFGRHPTDAAKPAHGFVRTSPWRVVSSDARKEVASLALEFEPLSAHVSLWPYRARVRLEIVVSQALTLALTTTNVGAETVPLTQALHSYFAVSDVSAVSIDGLHGATYVDHVGALQRRRQSGSIVIDAEVDRVYEASEETVLIRDEGFDRTIAIAKSGSRATVVWNPWIAKSQRLGDMGPEGHRRMVCVETANAGDDVVTVAPGATHRLTATISTVRG
ncbi:MAG: D-hexose-6-phosphate mutarotase [Hyphomicrobium sp.]